MDLNEMLIFTRVVQAGSFTAAARNLRIPKSTLSRKISQLEKRLGVRLLQRTTRHLGTTEIGASYYERSSRIVAEIEEAEKAVTSMQSTPRGTLRITTAVEFGIEFLGDAVHDFLKLYPEVKVEIILTGRLVDLIEENVDLAIRFGDLEDSTLSARKLGSGSLAMYASPAYLKKNPAPKTLEDLSKHECIHFTSIARDPIWELIGPTGQTRRIPVSARLLADNMTLTRDAALAGQGIALLSPMVALESVRAGKLKAVLPDWNSGDDPIHAVYPSGRYLTPKVRAFIDFVAARVAQTQWAKPTRAPKT